MDFVIFGRNEVSEEDLRKYHFDYIKPDEKTAEYIENARSAYKTLLAQLHSISPSRERSIAITELETSLVFATKAIVVAYKSQQGQ